MDKQNQVLVLQPNDQLQFQGTFKDAVTAYLKLTNVSGKNIVYRLEAISPYTFCITPQSGSLDPNICVDIAVSVQPFEFPFQKTNKHEIVVQHFVAPCGEVNSEELWEEVHGDEIILSKVECAFDFGESYCSTSGEQVIAEHETLSTGISEIEQSSFDIDSSIISETSNIRNKQISETSKCFRMELKDPDYITNKDKVGKYEDILVMSAKVSENINSDEGSIKRIVSLDRRSQHLERENYHLKQELMAMKELHPSFDAANPHIDTSTDNSMLFVIVSVVFLFIGIAIGKFISSDMCMKYMFV